MKINTKETINFAYFMASTTLEEAMRYTDLEPLKWGSNHQHKECYDWNIHGIKKEIIIHHET